MGSQKSPLLAPLRFEQFKTNPNSFDPDPIELSPSSYPYGG
jgi:hypothetical protein